MSLIDICSKYTLNVEQTFCKPNVPNKKSANAIEKYAKGIDINDIIVLVDDTAFGSARDGFVLSVQGLYGHEIFSDACFIGLDKIDNIYSIGKDIYVNNEKFISINLMNKVAIASLCKMLMEIVVYLKSSKKQTSTSSKNDKKENNPKFNTEMLSLLEDMPFSNKRIHTFPNIPQNKSLNAINSYAKGVSHDNILLLYDDTAFGGAKDGFLITNNSIIFHELFGNTFCIMFEDVKNVQILDNNIIINKNNVFTLTSIGELDVRKLRILFEKISDMYALENMSRFDREVRQILIECSSSKEFALLDLILSSREFRNEVKYNLNTEMIAFIDRVTLNMKRDDYNIKSSIKINSKPIPNAIKSMLSYTFSYQDKFSLDGPPIFQILLMTDSIIHELLLFLIYRGSRIINKSFEDEARRASALDLFTQEAMYNNFLLPLYKYKSSIQRKNESLKYSNITFDYDKFYKNHLHSRIIFNTDDQDILLEGLRALILYSSTHDYLQFNMSALSDEYNINSSKCSHSELLTEAYASLHDAIKVGMADNFLLEFIDGSDAELLEIIAQLLAKLLAD